MEPEGGVRLPTLDRVRRGVRSSCDTESWECFQCGSINLPVEKLLFDLPAFHCRGCEAPFLGEMNFCYDLVKANKRSLIGGLDNIKNQYDKPECIAYSIASCLEIADRIKTVLQGKNPDSVKEIDPIAIVDMFDGKCLANCSDGTSGIGKLVTMALAVQTDGIQSADHSRLYTAVAVETIDKYDFEGICATLADGIPLVGAFYCGSRLEKLEYCQIYRVPKLSKFLDRNLIPTGHAAVIIGAGMRCGIQYLYFLNSWGNFFCPRYDKDGNLVKAGVGKLRFYDLLCNPIMFITDSAKRVGLNRQLLPMGTGKLSDHNKSMLMGRKQTDVIPEDLSIGVTSEFVGNQPQISSKRKMANATLDGDGQTQKRNKCRTFGRSSVDLNEANNKRNAKEDEM